MGPKSEIYSQRETARRPLKDESELEYDERRARESIAWRALEARAERLQLDARQSTAGKWAQLAYHLNRKRVDRAVTHKLSREGHCTFRANACFFGRRRCWSRNGFRLGLASIVSVLCCYGVGLPFLSSRAAHIMFGIWLFSCRMLRPGGRAPRARCVGSAKSLPMPTTR